LYVHIKILSFPVYTQPLCAFVEFSAGINHDKRGEMIKKILFYVILRS